MTIVIPLMGVVHNVNPQLVALRLEADISDVVTMHKSRKF
jgi:hypothetical protein